MPTALVSKSAKGMDAARSWLGCAAVWTMASGLNLLHQVDHALAVADVEFVMHKALDGPLKTMLIPARIALGAEKHGTLIVVDTVNLPAFGGKKRQTSDPIRPDEPVTRTFFIEHSLLQ